MPIWLIYLFTGNIPGERWSRYLLSPLPLKVVTLINPLKETFKGALLVTKSHDAFKTFDPWALNP